jgi:PHD/YefM family antitoxin component YafN of YafNO toxin-antitoxin module
MMTNQETYLAQQGIRAIEHLAEAMAELARAIAARTDQKENDDDRASHSRP